MAEGRGASSVATPDEEPPPAVPGAGVTVPMSRFCCAGGRFEKSGGKGGAPFSGAGGGESGLKSSASSICIGGGVGCFLGMAEGTQSDRSGGTNPALVKAD